MREIVLPAQYEQVLERKIGAIDDAQARTPRLGLGDGAFDAPLLGSRSAASGLVIDDANAAVRLQRLRQSPQECDAVRFFDLLVGVNDEDGIECACRQIEVCFAA